MIKYSDFSIFRQQISLHTKSKFQLSDNLEQNHEQTIEL
jgi:hypothetical protein